MFLFHCSTRVPGLMILLFTAGCVSTMPPRTLRVEPRAGEPIRRVLEPDSGKASADSSSALEFTGVTEGPGCTLEFRFTQIQECDLVEEIPRDEVVLVEREAHGAWALYGIGAALLGGGIWAYLDAQENLTPRNSVTAQWEITRDMGAIAGLSMIGAGVLSAGLGGLTHILAMDDMKRIPAEPEVKFLERTRCKNLSQVEPGGEVIGVSALPGPSPSLRDQVLVVPPPGTISPVRICEAPVTRIRFKSDQGVMYKVAEGLPLASIPGGVEVSWLEVDCYRDRIYELWNGLADKELLRMMPGSASPAELAVRCRQLISWLDTLTNEAASCTQALKTRNLGYRYGSLDLSRESGRCLAMLEQDSSAALAARDLVRGSELVELGLRLAGLVDNQLALKRLGLVQAELNRGQGELFEASINQAITSFDVARAEAELAAMEAWSANVGGPEWGQRAAALRARVPGSNPDQQPEECIKVRCPSLKVLEKVIKQNPGEVGDDPYAGFRKCRSLDSRPRRECLKHQLSECARACGCRSDSCMPKE